MRLSRYDIASRRVSQVDSCATVGTTPSTSLLGFYMVGDFGRPWRLRPAPGLPLDACHGHPVIAPRGGGNPIETFVSATWQRLWC
jgi:hypothetical protein